MKKVFIYGSCVSRDIFELDSIKHRVEICYYQARSSMASAFSSEVIQDQYTSDLTSNFQRRMVSVDLDKTLPDLIQKTSFDSFLIDLIDERYDLYLTKDNQLITLSSELLSVFEESNRPEGRVIESRSEEFFFLWEKGWKSLISAAKKDGWIDKILVNKVYWAGVDDAGALTVKSSHQGWLDSNNAQLGRMYQRMADDLKDFQFIAYPEGIFVADINHKWGCQPFHYVESVYQKAILYIDCFLFANFNNRVLLGSNNSPRIDLTKIVNRIVDWRESSSYIMLIRQHLGQAQLFNIQMEYECDHSAGQKDFLLSLHYLSSNCLHLTQLTKSSVFEVGWYSYIPTVANQHKRYSVVIEFPESESVVFLSLKYFYPKGKVTLKSLSIEEKLIEKTIDL